jgi:citrate synthase
MAEKETVTITDNRTGTRVDLPIKTGTHGPDVFDIRKMYANLGMFTYDPGFVSTATCSSFITYIDGDEGILLYRGYPIEQLAEKSSYIEVCYLLLNGELPSEIQLETFTANITRHTMVHEGMRRFYSGFRHDAHPMAFMLGSVGAMSSFYHDSTDVTNPRHREISAHRLIAKMPTLAADSYKYSMGLPFNFPKNRLDYSENFLYMMFALPTEEYVVNPIHARALNLILILHADHEQNASTSSVRCQPIRQCLCRYCIPVGAGTWWRQ